MPHYRARAHFNNRLGLFDVPQPDAAERARRAADHIPGISGYRKGDPLRPSQIMVEVDAATPQAACDEVFRVLNEDERPNGQIEPSLSVGDLVALEAEHEGVTFAWFAVEALGFRRVSPPAASALAAAEQS